MNILKHILLFLYFTTLSSLAFSQEAITRVDKRVNFGYRQVNNRKIDAIIIHSTFNNSGGDYYDIDLVIKQFSRYKVSSHYVIGRDGTIYNLVKESDIAFHAGSSVLPDGRSGINSCSIGIEIMTSFEDAPTEEQITALLELISIIKCQYPIKYVLRHSDIAPSRKTDPWNMDWECFQKRLGN